MVNFKDIKKYCINLPQAKERRAKVEKEFARMGIEVEFINGICYPEDIDGYRGNTATHLKILQQAVKDDLKYICLFEDDVAFADDFWSRVNLNYKFDIFYLGGHSLSFNFTKTKEKNIYRVILIGGTYAVIYNRKAIDFMVKYMTEDSGADAFVGNVACRKLNAIAQLPFMVYTDDKYSWITRKESNLSNPLWQYEPKWDKNKEYELKKTSYENT